MVSSIPRLSHPFGGSLHVLGNDANILWMEALVSQFLNHLRMVSFELMFQRFLGTLVRRMRCVFRVDAGKHVFVF